MSGLLSTALSTNMLASKLLLAVAYLTSLIPKAITQGIVSQNVFVTFLDDEGD